MQLDYEIIDLLDQKFEQLYTVVQQTWHRCMLLLNFIIIQKRNASVYDGYLHFESDWEYFNGWANISQI